MMKFTPCGIIGKSGRWYPCEHGEHIMTKRHRQIKSDGPFVEVKQSGEASFDAYYASNRAKPTRAQFETLMDWCIAHGEKFEEVTGCWSEPWRDCK